MKFLDRAKSLKDNDAVKNGGLSVLEDIGNALFGNPISAAKVLYKGPAFIQDLTFVTKFEAFLMGLDLDEEEMLKLAAQFAEDGNKNDNAIRLVSCLERVDTLKKINCLVNATRCLLARFITMDEYFRICQAVNNTLLEDLMFLREHIHEEDLEYSRFTQGLFTSGLVYESVLGDGPKYSFTPLGKDVDRFAISFKDVERYPNPLQIEENEIHKAIDVPALTADDFDSIIDAVDKKYDDSVEGDS